jgi:hypothetical protein
MNVLPIDGRTLQQKILDARQLLEENGYIVHGPFINGYEVNSVGDLVKFFYDKMFYYNPGLLLSYSGSKKQDLDLAKKFLKSRMDLGLGKKRAIEECCLIIDSLFKYETHIGLKSKITSMSVLGQDTMAWVTTKILNFINGLDNEVNEHEESVWHNKLYLEQEAKDDPKGIALANKRLGLEDADGKKEK